MAGIGLRLLPESANPDAYFGVQFYEPVLAAAFSSATGKDASGQAQFVGYQHSYGRYFSGYRLLAYSIPNCTISWILFVQFANNCNFFIYGCFCQAQQSNKK
jgi:hypothetical protein